ncbi:DUF721 domain-containing protein [Vibrio sp. S11_S32]|nr:DUF721 domain-containing protein [Vibrio sp. S11_S32]
MRDHRPTLTKDLFTDPRMNQFNQHVSDILAINKTLQSILAPAFRPHCRAANIKNSQLLIEVANASLQMKLNYDRIHILSQLRANGFSKLSGIEFKVNPDLYRAEPINEKSAPPYQPTGLSESAAQSILMIADLASPKLKRQIERLAKLGKK